MKQAAKVRKLNRRIQAWNELRKYSGSVSNGGVGKRYPAGYRCPGSLKSFISPVRLVVVVYVEILLPNLLSLRILLRTLCFPHRNIRSTRIQGTLK
jgi:hypothetical protein